MHDVFDDEPPFVVVNGAADFLALEQSDASLWILVWDAHGWFIPSWRFDDEPTDELKVGGFGRLVFFVWNHEAALGL